MSCKSGKGTCVPRPFFQQLRRCFHKVLLCIITANPNPLVSTAEQCMYQVPKLMKKSYDIFVRHQPGITRFAARKIADQSRLRHLSPMHPGSDIELCCVLVFILARE